MKPAAGRDESHSDAGSVMEEPRVYVHSALAEDDIRLLRLNSYENSRLHCEVWQFSLQDCPSYSALSYTWGDSSWSMSVSLNDQEFKVTPNLHAFLKEAYGRRERGEWESTWLWIDAICIDQSNYSERNRCVATMKTIYEGASKIICWLGSVIDPRRESAALACIDRLEKLFNEPASHKFRLDVTSHEVAAQWNGTLFESEELSFTDLDIDSLRLIFRAPWWTRAWIVQEASTPKPLGSRTIWFGSHERSFEHISRANKSLSNAANASRDYHRNLRVRCASLDVLDSICEARKEILSGTGQLSIFKILPFMRTYEASDERDKIFCLYSICTDSHHPALEPNYSLPDEELWFNVTRYYLEEHDDLDILGHCSYSKRNAGVPTWVPDWSSHQLPVPFARRRRDSTAWVLRTKQVK